MRQPSIRRGVRTRLGIFGTLALLLILFSAFSAYLTELREQMRCDTLEKLDAAGIRVKVDDRDEKLGYKIRQAQLQKVPYMLILGEKEQSAGTVSVRKRDLIDENDSPELGTMSVEEFAAIIKEESQY